MEEDLKEASASIADLPKRSSFALRPGKRKLRLFRKILIGIGVVLLIGSVVFAAWRYLVKKDHETAKASTVQSGSTSQPSQKTTLDANAKQFLPSESLGIGFDYPNDWTATESNGGIAILSPVFTYETANGNKAEGNFKIYIRKGARAEDGVFFGKGYAAKDSQELAYTKPAKGQSSKTLLQTFGYNDASNFAYFMLASNYKLKAGDTLGKNYGKEPNTILVVGGFSDPSLKQDFEMNKMSLDKYESYQQYKQAISIVQTLNFN